MSISTLKQVTDILNQKGFEVKEMDKAVAIAVGDTEHPYVGVITNDDEGSFIIDCQVASKGDILDDNWANFCSLALDLNSRIAPYSLCILTDTDGEESEENEWPILLRNKVTIGDLCDQELEAAIDHLLSAIQQSVDVLKVGLGVIQVEETVTV